MTNENGTQTTEAQAAEVPFEVPEGYRLLTDAEAELMASQLVESRQEQWEVQEIVDNAVIAGEFNALMRNELYYEFKQGGKQVRGLTAKMIGHLATAQGVSEVIEQRKVSGEAEDAEKYEFEVVVEMPDPNNPQRMLYRTGYAEEPKEAYEKYDKFAKAKAHTKAFRNACLKFLPQDLIMATTFKLANLVPADWTPKPQQKALPAAQNGTQTDAQLRDEKAAFATYNDRAEQLEKLGITKEIFWAGVKTHFKVKSRTDMTAAQYQELREALNVKDFANWIQDLAPKPVAETETETTETDKEADQPF